MNDKVKTLTEGLGIAMDNFLKDPHNKTFINEIYVPAGLVFTLVVALWVIWVGK